MGRNEVSCEYAIEVTLTFATLVMNVIGIDAIEFDFLGQFIHHKHDIEDETVTAGDSRFHLVVGNGGELLSTFTS